MPRGRHGRDVVGRRGKVPNFRRVRGCEVAIGGLESLGVHLTNPSEPNPPAVHGTAGLKAVRPENRYLALGTAVAFLMVDPAFRGLQFGHWAQVLAGQIRRGHFLFVMDRNTVVGFAGWALTNRDEAEEWLEGRRELSFEESQAGEFVILNVWKATTPAANRFLIDAFRRLFRSKQALYYKRFYADGRMRAARLRVNDFVVNHVDSKQARVDSTSPGAPVPGRSGPG